MDHTLDGLGVDPDCPIKDLPDDMKKHLAKYKSKKAVKPKKVKPKVPFVGENHPKYRVTLKLANKILTNLGKPEIDDLLDFKDVDRLDIIKDENREALVEMENEILTKEAFTRSELLYYRESENKVLNVLRSMVKNIGLTLQGVQKDRYDRINSKVYRSTTFFYTVSI